MAEVETGLLLQKARQAELMIEAIRAEKAQSEREKKALEQKTVEAESLAKSMQEDAIKRKLESGCCCCCCCCCCYLCMARYIKVLFEVFEFA